MSTPISASSLIQMLSLSGLLSDEQLRKAEQHCALLTNEVSARALCEWLRFQQFVTEWQSEKLLQGRYRGFFLGPYRLLYRVARGGMSTIYAALHKETGEIHALKVLPLSRTGDASFLTRFQREAEITRRLQHPHIVKVWNVYSESDGQNSVHFMSMELLHGRDLFELVNLEGPLPWQDAAEYIRQAATGLAYAHQEGLVHRDIKPGNLFLTGDSSVKILDLGLAQNFDSEESLTREYNERVLGTADYLAPEQARDCHTVDHRADIYSLGCSFYFLLTGQAPFSEGSLIQRLMAHQTKTPTQISQFRDDVPDEITMLLARMMATDRNMRIGSAHQVAEQLALFLGSANEDSEGTVPTCPDIEKSVAACAQALCLSADVPFGLRELETHGASGLKQEISVTEELSSLANSGRRLVRRVALNPADADYLNLLELIEDQCALSESLAADPRSRELLEFAKQLQHRSTDVPQDTWGYGTVALAQRHQVHGAIDTGPSSRRGVLWLCFILGLLAVTAAVVSWNRFF